MSSGSNAQPAVDFALTELRLAQAALGVDIAQAILNLVLLIVTGVSVYYAFRAYRHQKERAKKDAACELARYYAHDIIHRSTFLSYTITQCGIAQKIKDLFALEKLKDFSLSERNRLLQENGLSPSQVEEVSKELVMLDPWVIYNGMIRNAKSEEERNTLAAEYLDTSDIKAKPKIKNRDLLLRTFVGEVNMLLNDLEWFAMSCQYGLADEEMLYQSLHSTFLSQIWMLYNHICLANYSSEDKLFTNVIWLFNLWRDRLKNLQSENQEEAKRISQEIEHKELELAEARKKAQQMEPKIHIGKQLK